MKTNKDVIKRTAVNMFDCFMYASGVTFWVLFSYGAIKGCIENAKKKD